MDERVRFELGEDAVGVVTLNRPDKLNALDRGVFEGLQTAAAEARTAAERGDCRAVLLQGAGRAFCSGLDVSLFGETLASNGGDVPPEDGDWIAPLQEAFTVWEDLPVPTVAAIHGVALGGGCQLAIACHLRVAAPDASFAILETNWGIIPDLGATYRLPRLLGLSRAIDLAVSARRIDAQTALAWGLVDAVLEEEDFATSARAYAARLAAGPTKATGAIPRLMREGLGRDRAAVLAAERATQVGCLASDDFKEAVAAALEGRKPEFQGR